MKNQLLKHFIQYATTSLLCRGLIFLMAPITISFLSPTEFGLLSLTNSFVVIMTIIIGLGLRNVLSLEYFHGNQETRTKLISDLIITYFLLAVPIFGFLLINQSFINHYFFCNQSSASLIVISFILCFFMFLVEFFQQLLQYQAQISLATKLQLTAAVCTVLLTIFFLSFFHWGVTSIITAQLLAILLIYGKPFLRIAIHNRNTILLSLHKITKRIPHYLNCGLPFIPGMLCNWIMASGDRWVLANYSNLHNVGIYTIADAFGSLFHIIVSNSIAAVYIPHLLQQFADHKDKLPLFESKNKKTMYLSMAGAFIVVTIGYLVARPILFWILPCAYQEAIPYIWLTFIGYILLMGTYFASIFIQFHKKAYFLSLSLLLPALFNIILNRLFIPHFAIYGCITATISSYLLYFCITLLYNYHLHKNYTFFLTAQYQKENESIIMSKSTGKRKRA